MQGDMICQNAAPGMTCRERPSESPSALPSMAPSALPSMAPSSEPSVSPSMAPSDVPSTSPSVSGSDTPSALPSSEPSLSPSVSQMPSMVPSDQPSDVPSASPSDQPSRIPSESPSDVPSTTSSVAPSDIPSVSPSDAPSSIPSEMPSTTCNTLPAGNFVARNNGATCDGVFNMMDMPGEPCGTNTAGDANCCASSYQLDNSGTVVSDPICCPAGTLMCTEQGETECCIGFTTGVDFCPSGGGCPPPQSFYCNQYLLRPGDISWGKRRRSISFCNGVDPCQ